MLTRCCAGLFRVRVAGAEIADQWPATVTGVRVAGVSVWSTASYLGTQVFNEEVARAASQIVPRGRQDEDAGLGRHRRVFSPPGLVDCRAVWLRGSGR